jgi:hypothetical protein
MKPKIEKIDRNKRIRKTKTVITNVKDNKVFVDGGGEFRNTTWAKPSGDEEDVIDIPPDGNPFSPAPPKFQERAILGQTKRSK